MSTVDLMLQSKMLIQVTEANVKESDYDLLKKNDMSVTTIPHFPHNIDYNSMISAVPTQGSYQATLPGSTKSDRIIMKLNSKKVFKPLDSSSSIIDGKIHSLNGTPHEGLLQKAKLDTTKKIPKSDEQERKKFISIAPTPLKDGPSVSLSFSSPKTSTKVVMSTVAKRVPLLSTGPGNVSKVQAAVLIQAKKIAEEATKSNGSLKSVDTCAANAAVTSRAATSVSSILAARLTAPRPLLAAPSSETEPNEPNASELLLTTEAQESLLKEGEASVTSVGAAQAAANGSEPVATISQLEVAKPITVCAVPAGHEVTALFDADSCATSPVSSVSGISSTSPTPDVLHTTTEPNGAEGLSVGMKYQVVRTIPQSGPSKQCVLSYEKGLTRLAAVERRTLTLVDVGMQVFIPGESKPHLTAPESMTPSCVHNHLSKMSQAGLPISKGSTVPVISTASPLTLNTKSGKLVVAVPKQVLNGTGGPKTFIIGGKPVTVQIKGSLGQVRTMKSDGTTTPILPTISGSKTMVINSPSLVTTPQQGRDIAGLSLPVTEITTPSIVVTTASIATPPRNNMYPASTLKTPPRDGHSLVLPLNSPIQSSPSKDTSENASVQALPNTTSLLIMIPNSLQPRAKLSESKVLPSTQVVSLTSEVVHSDNSQKTSQNSPTTEDNISRSNKRPCSESTDVQPSKVQCVESSKKSTVFEEKETYDSGYSSIPARPTSVSPKQMDVSIASHNLGETSYEKGKENIPIEEMGYELHIEDNYQGETSNTLWSSIDTILPRRNSKSDILPNNKDAKKEVNLVVKNALSDFRNCLVPNKSGDMPIHVAVQGGNPSAVQRQCIVLAARKAPLDLPNGRDETPLQVALFCGFSPIVKVLLKYGADPTVTDKEGNSTLHLAVLHADEEAVCALLTTKKLENKMDDFNDEGFTALHLAAHQGKVEVLTLLVKNGATVDLGDAKSGRTALYHAIERRQYWAQKELLKHGADLMEPSFTGTTPLSVTRSDMFAQLNSGQQEVIDVLDADTLMKKNHRRKKK